jgi:hypothetical protein
MLSDKTLEKRYMKTGEKFQLRTSKGRLLSESMNIEHIEHKASLGRGRILYQRIYDFGKIIWLDKRVGDR